MKKIEDFHLNRCNVNVEDEIKNWYMCKARSMGMSMSQLMSYVIYSYYEQHTNSDALKALASLSSDDNLRQTNNNLSAFILECQKLQNQGEL